jgi:hypothetical protein
MPVADLPFRVVGDAAHDPDSIDFAMYSEAGNIAVARLVADAKLAIVGVDSYDTAMVVIRRLVADIAAEHPEVNDTMVADTIAASLDADMRVRFGRPAGDLRR